MGSWHNAERWAAENEKSFNFSSYGHACSNRQDQDRTYCSNRHTGGGIGRGRKKRTKRLFDICRFRNRKERTKRKEGTDS